MCACEGSHGNSFFKRPLPHSSTLKASLRRSITKKAPPVPGSTTTLTHAYDTEANALDTREKSGAGNEAELGEQELELADAAVVDASRAELGVDQAPAQVLRIHTRQRERNAVLGV